MCGGKVMEVQWPLVFFTLLTGLGVSAFSCVAVTEWLGVAESIRMQGAMTALVAMAMGGGLSLLHLSHPFRTYHISKHFETGMGKEMLLIGLSCFALHHPPGGRFLSPSQKGCGLPRSDIQHCPGF